MKVFYFFLILIFFHNTSLSQDTRFNEKDSAKIADIKYIQYDLENFGKSNLAIKLPISKIIFFDVRYDTSFIAISWHPNINSVTGAYNQNSKYNLTNGLTASLATYFNEFYKNNFSRNNAEIACFIKRFSITPKGSIIAIAQSNNENENVNNIKFEVECYYKAKDLLYPAIRIDTSYAERSTRIKKSFLEITREILQPLIDRVPLIDSAKMQKRHSYTLQQIQERYQGRFNLPILTTDQYKRGIYKSFQEFINNSPSITEFSIKNKGYNVLLYNSSGAIISSKIFGFYDGEICWVYGGAYCSPLIKVGNSFEYFYTLYILKGIVQTSKKFLLVLDMENSEIE